MRIIFLFLCLFLITPFYAKDCFSATETAISNKLTNTDLSEDTDSVTITDSLTDSETENNAFHLKEESLSVFWKRVGQLSKKVDEIKSEIEERTKKERFSKDDIHPADVLLWNEKDFSPITEYEGIGDWTEYPCMKTRLLADTTGTLRRPWFSGGIDVVLGKGCLFKNPEISIDETVNTASLHFFIPYLFPLSETQHHFKERVVFPFVASPEKQGEKGLLAVTISGELCAEKQECVFVALPMRLHLSGETGDVTSVSAYVHKAFEKIPLFVEEDKMSAVRLSDKTIQLRVKSTSPRGKQDWIIKRGKKLLPFKITEAFVWKEYGYLKFEFEEDITNAELTFVLKEDRKFFERTFKADIGTPFVMPDIVSFNWFKIALMFFFLSPWLAFVMLFNPKNDYEVQKKTTPIIMQVLLFSVIAFIFLKTGLVAQNPFESEFWRWSIFAVFLGAWLFPIKKSAFSFALLSFCAPLMYLEKPMEIYPNTTLFVCTLTALMPFICAKKNPHLMLKLWVGLRDMNDRVKKLPLFFCAVWILLMQGAIYYNKNADYPTFSPVAVEKAVSEGKVVLVLGGDKTSITSAWNKFFWKKTKARHWFPLVVVKTEDKRSQFLYGPLEPKGIKLPDYLEDYEIEEVFRKVIAED